MEEKTGAGSVTLGKVLKRAELPSASEVERHIALLAERAALTRERAEMIIRWFECPISTAEYVVLLQIEKRIAELINL